MDLDPIRSRRGSRVLVLVPLLMLLMLLGAGLLAADEDATNRSWAGEPEAAAVVESSPVGRDSAPEPERRDGWEYDSYYIFPLTRHLSESGLPLAAQIALYPIGFVLDLGQWPVGVVAGLASR